MRAHPHDAWILGAAEGRGKSLDRVLEHLSNCAKCRRRCDRLKAYRLASPLSSQENYGPALDRSFDLFQRWQAALEQERREAPALLASLVSLVPGQRQLFMRNDRRFQSWGLFELLIHRGREETFTDPRHAEELFQLAIDISAQLSSSVYDAKRIEDLRARAWGYTANARRVRMDFQASTEAFEEAFRHLHRGTEDPLEKALLFDLKASLRRALLLHGDSLELSRKAISIFRKMGQAQLVGRAILKSSITYAEMGNPGQAILSLYESLPLIDQALEPRLTLCLFTNLSDDLAEAGRFMEAQGVLVRARHLYHRCPDPRTQNHHLWTEAKVAWGFGRFREAELLFERAHAGFMAIQAFREANLLSEERKSRTEHAD
jgi:tetratricopeptide (TPR) repeat protein